MKSTDELWVVEINGSEIPTDTIFESLEEAENYAKELNNSNSIKVVTLEKHLENVYDRSVYLD